MRRVYKYRLYPTRKQCAAMDSTLERLRHLYNAALQERRDAWQKQRLSISKKNQDHQLKAIREDDPEYKALHFHLLQDVTKRLDLAYQAFFRRVKAGQMPGHPRFKGRDRYRTFTFKDVAHRNGAYVMNNGKKVHLSGVGNVKVRLHRPFEGVVKQISVTKTGYGHWYVQYICDDVPAKPLPPTGKATGIDLGIENFVALPDGEMVPNPRYSKAGAPHVAIAQRRQSRRVKRSNRWRKAVRLVAVAKAKESRRRDDYQHKVALDLIQRFDIICVEELNILGLARGWLRKHVYDVAWGSFLGKLKDKAGSAGRELRWVDPRGTSQRCSRCGTVVLKDLNVRTHRCPHCGLVIHRDTNSAREIFFLGMGRPFVEADAPFSARRLMKREAPTLAA